MTLALISFMAVGLLEALLWLPSIWRWRKPLARLVGLGATITSALVIGYFPNVWTSIVVILSIYRVINLIRVADGQTQIDYLYRVARQSSLRLIALQALLGALAGLHSIYNVGTLPYLYIISAVQLLAALVLLISTRRHLRTTTPPTITEAYADRDLPSLTVAIPARNETEDLQRCLESLVASSYPKLEILVLDDCSQERRTPEIIRGFAQKGVTFIAGDVPPDNWVAKNHAYQRLVEKSSGQLILFCGVDTRFKPDSLRVLVETLLEKKKTMLCVLPQNQVPRGWQSLLVQPSRYAWELALPRRWLQRPPVLSTCWLITSSALHAAGGFKAVSRSHSPESHFAKYTATHSDGYSFIQSGRQIALQSAKSFEEQRATAIRTRYPQLHRRIELVGLLSLLEVATLLAPFCTVVAAVILGNGALLSVSLLTSLLLSITYIRLVTLTYHKFLLRSLVTVPFAAIYDICLLNYSMWQYEFNEVIWKGRNICVPVMRTIPRLPKV